MNSNDIDKFIERNISNFRVNGNGWNDLIKKMLFEFCLAGWDINIDTGGKEKYGGLVCYIRIEDKDAENKITNITRKYSLLAAKTCEYCGNPGKHRVDPETKWEITLCRNCYINDELRKIKHSPGKKEPTELAECKICGYLAVAENKCNFCNNNTYSGGNRIFNPADHYNTEIEYIKECQMEMFIDEDDEIELSRRTKHFFKSGTHQVLFSNEELENFINSRAED